MCRTIILALAISAIAAATAAPARAQDWADTSFASVSDRVALLEAAVAEHDNRLSRLEAVVERLAAVSANTLTAVQQQAGPRYTPVTSSNCLVPRLDYASARSADFLSPAGEIRIAAYGTACFNLSLPHGGYIAAGNPSPYGTGASATPARSAEPAALLSRAEHAATLRAVGYQRSIHSSPW